MGFGAFGVLVLGAQPTDQAGGLFFYPLGVQRDYTFEDFSVRQGRRPAVGGEDGGVQIVMELAENGDEALIVD